MPKLIYIAEQSRQCQFPALWICACFFSEVHGETQIEEVNRTYEGTRETHAMWPMKHS